MASFERLTPEALARDRARRAAAEPEIARKEAALAEAEAGLLDARSREADTEQALQAERSEGDDPP